MLTVDPKVGFKYLSGANDEAFVEKRIKLQLSANFSFSLVYFEKRVLVRRRCTSLEFFSK